VGLRRRCGMLRYFCGGVRTSFWAEKKQETFFRFPAWCAAVLAADI